MMEKTIYFQESFKDKLFEKIKWNKLKYGQVNLYSAVDDNGKWKDVVPLKRRHEKLTKTIDNFVTETKY
jgi:hypothetical protein